MILIALGSNLTGPWGTPRQAILKAVTAMEHEGIHVRRLSTLIETAPYGNPNQPHYVNGAARVETHKTPDALMRCLHMIEHRAGRRRGRRWGARTLDLDLIDFHGLVRRKRSLDIKPLVLPHPGVLLRGFVLEPVAEIAPDWRHPVTHQSAADVLRLLKD
mgnify:CR=1 FL=1